MILLFAGRRPSSDDFPHDNVDFVAAQVDQLVAGLRPRAVVGSAAAGGDLLVLEAAAKLDVPAHIVLAGDSDAFLASSVQDKGEDWARRYRAVLPGAETVREIERSDASEDSYHAVTLAIGDVGRRLANDGEEIVVLAVSKPRDGGVDHTEELVQQHRARHLVLRIDPARRDGDTESAFVAMPFGVKPYPDRGWREYDADLTYQRIILPALLDAGYKAMRADTDALLEVIDHTMLRELNGSEVVVADLAMLNANVMWELGLRHAWRRSGTVLVAPMWVKNPFDVARVPLHHYDRSAQALGEAEQRAAIEHLQRVFADVPQRRVDSPVFANLTTLEEVRLPEPPAQRDGHPGASELLAQLTHASDLGRAERLRELADEIRSEPHLSETVQRSLLEQAGLALIGLGEYTAARGILAPLAEADTKFERRTLQEQYAHAVIRSDGVSDELLREAEARLRAVVERHGPRGEPLGLLGSVSKKRVEDAVFASRAPASADLRAAIDAYRRGFVAEPTDAYPGINALALLRLRGQRWGGTDADLEAAAELLPVVRFATGRRPEAIEEDIWTLLTVAQCDVEAHLLSGDPAMLESARERFEDAAARVRPQQRGSATRQLRLMLAAGDPPEVIEPLLAPFRKPKP
jgi:hypothetical protein